VPAAWPIVVPPALDLLRWVEEFLYRFHHKAFPVVSDGHLEECITTQALAGIPRGQWDQHTVGEVMRRDLRTITIPPDADALDALGRMRRAGSSRLLVVEPVGNRHRSSSSPRRERPEVCLMPSGFCIGYKNEPRGDSSHVHANTKGMRNARSCSSGHGGQSV
jgi:CBS domain-containing protein